MKIDSFIDNAMIQVAKKFDTTILDETYKATIDIGVHIDKERLKKWLEQCAYLENIDESTKIDIAIRLKFNKLKKELNKVRLENSLLKNWYNNLKGENDD